MLSVSMQNEDFNKFKAEQRTLLEQRNQIQKRIESMRREYDFIQNLDARALILISFILQGGRGAAPRRRRPTYRLRPDAAKFKNQILAASAAKFRFLNFARKR